MVVNLAKIVSLYIAPVLYLTALFLSIFAYVGPVPILHTAVSLAIVYPATPMKTVSVVKRELFPTEVGPDGEIRKFPRAFIARQVAAAAAPKIDGPTVRLGALGSCARKNNAANDICTAPSFDPTYDFSVLPTIAPLGNLPPAPASTTPVFYLLALIFSGLFFFSYLLITLPDRGLSLPKPVSKIADNALLSKMTAWMGLFAFAIGLLTTIMWQVQFHKDVKLFNQKVAALGSKAPQLQAALGNGFTMLWVAYAFKAPTLLCALFKLQIDKAAGKF